MTLSFSNVPIESTCTKCGHKVSQTVNQFIKLPAVKCALCQGAMIKNLSAVKQATQRNVEKKEKLMGDLMDLKQKR